MLNFVCGIAGRSVLGLRYRDVPVQVRRHLRRHQDHLLLHLPFRLVAHKVRAFHTGRPSKMVSISWLWHYTHYISIFLYTYSWSEPFSRHTLYDKMNSWIHLKVTSSVKKVSLTCFFCLENNLSKRSKKSETRGWASNRTCGNYELWVMGPSILRTPTMRCIRFYSKLKSPCTDIQ